MVNLTITNARVELSPGSEVVLPNQTWADYEALLAVRQDNAAVKVRYSARDQEIRMMAPLPRHGKISLTLSDIVQALLKHTERDWEGFDPVTLKRFEEAGVEPDRCFYIEHREAILGKEQIDLDRDPPPDLAIEVDVTSATKPEDYAAIGVPELWIYRDGKLSIYLYDGQQYHASQHSRNFPNLPLHEWIPPYLQRAWTAGSSVALREFEKMLRDAGTG